MASLQKKGNCWYCQFIHGGRRHTAPLGAVSDEDAAGIKARYEQLLRLLGQRLLSLPPAVDICAFLQNDGKPPAKDEVQPAPSHALTLGELRDRYLRTRSRALEPNTLATIRTHFGHLAETFREAVELKGLGMADLQKHIDRRQDVVQAGTIKMEIVSLRTAWNWAVRAKMLADPFPGAGLSYPKAREKPHFMTWEEVERRISLGGDAAELWDCLYLTTDEVGKLLEHVRGKAVQPWVYPMAAFAAHTGARRSELLRVRAEDVDLKGGTVTIQEKKRRKGLDSTRRVPVSTLLRTALQEYLANRPEGCPLLFCQGPGVVRSRKSRETAEGVTKDEAHNHLERALKGSKWEVVRGWHVLRHSFISALANKGVDQRIVQELVGHMTDEMHRRYAHMYPSTKEQAVRSVFG
jgi:integrase